MPKARTLTEAEPDSCRTYVPSAPGVVEHGAISSAPPRTQDVIENEKSPRRPNELDPSWRKPEMLTAKSPREFSATVPLSEASPKKSSVTKALNDQPPLATTIRRPASKVSTLRMLTLPFRSSRKEFAATPTRVVFCVVFSSRVPEAEIENTGASAETLTETRIAKPGSGPPTTAAPPSRRNCRPPRSKATPKSSWKPFGFSLISRNPLPLAKPKLMLPLIRRRKPASTTVEPRVWLRPVVLRASTAPTEKSSPMSSPKSAASFASTRATRPWALIRKPESTTYTPPIGSSSRVPLTTSSMPGSAPASSSRRSTSPEMVSRLPMISSPAKRSLKPPTVVIVAFVETRLPAPSRRKPSKTVRSSAVPVKIVFVLTAKVEMTCWVVNVLISSSSWPLRLMPGMELLPRVSWMRPTMPVRVPR